MACTGDLRQGASLARISRCRSLHLEVRRGHPRRERPVLGAPNQRPTSLHRSPGIGHVAAPQREGGSGAGRGHLELGIRRVVDLERPPAEEARRALVDARLHLEHRGRDRCVGECDGIRAPLEGGPDRLPRLGPPAGVEERLGDVAAKRVAVGHLQAIGPCPLHRQARDLDRLLAPSEQGEGSRQVQRRAERDIWIVELVGEPEGVLELGDARVAIGAPGVGDTHGA